MPTYQYACTECDHSFEEVQSFSDDSLTTCPACGGRLRKVFNAVGVVFKGSGFYRTDNRAENRSGSSTSAPAAEKSSSGSESSSSEKATPKTTPATAASSTGSSSGSSSSTKSSGSND